MKLKGRIQGFVVGIIISIFSMQAFASTAQKNITVSYNNIKLYIDGALVTPKDADGNVVEPFIYEGTTYLPVRAVSEALGKSVSMDTNTASVYIGERSVSKLYLGEQLKAYTKSSLFVKEYPEFGEFEMVGKSCTRGVLKDTFTLNIDSALYNLDAKYKKLTGVYGPTDAALSKHSCVINIYGDNKLLGSFTSNFGDLPKEFSVDVTGVVQLKIEFDGYSNFAIADAYVE